MNFSYRNQANALAISKMYNKPLDTPDWYKIVSASKDGESEILLYDYIGWPFNDPVELIHALSDMGDVLVRINSMGGDVFDGTAISNALASHKGIVTTRIEGLAASIASVIAMAGKKVQAYDNIMLMIHNAWTCMCGNQYELRDVADLLEKIDGNILDAYQRKTKKSKKDLTEMMKATTWMTAQEAKDYGFVNEIVDGKSVKAAFELSMYANVPDSLLFQDVGKDLTRKELEHALRNAGASRSYAKMAASLVAAERSNADLEAQRNVENQAKEAKEAQEKEAVMATIKETLKSNISILTGR